MLLAFTLVATVAGGLGLAQAQDATPDASDNAAIARAFYEPFNSGETAIYDRILAEGWVDVPLGPGQQPGRAGFIPVIEGFRTVFPDLRVSNEDVIVAGDLVTVRSTLRGTHRGDFLGLPATGRTVTFAAIDIHRIEGGLIVESWHIEDYLSLIGQLGATIEPGVPASATPAP